MKNENRIIKYIENELTSEEKISFETELINSEELKTELGKYLKVKAKTEEIKNLKLNPGYLDSLLPEFHQKLASPKVISVKRNLGFAFGVMIMFILSILILQFIFTNKTEMNELQEFAQSLNENQKIELLENLIGESDYYDLDAENISGTEMTELLQSNLVINNDVAETYNISYTELVDELSETEVEKIYNEILNKNFFEEVIL
ncbi:MAG: hypothetical protein HXY48_08255 [Ignavibacteriaceae bacterium]|nr:hypothetical protein [Ignavibacteriaceae bacterium]